MQKQNYTTNEFDKQFALCYLSDDNIQHKIDKPNLKIPLQFWFNQDPNLALPAISRRNKKIKTRSCVFDKQMSELSNDPNFNNFNITALNYNALGIMSGFGALQYSA